MIAKLLGITVKVALSLFLAVIVGALVVLTVVPRAVGGAALTVLTGSMTPEIAVGSVVVVRPVDPGTLRVGDVVTYQKAPGQSAYVTHRITEVHTDTNPVTLTTKGDANRGADLDAVPVTAVRGKVLFDVPYLGTVKNAISTGGFGLLALILGLVGYALWQVVSAFRDRRLSPEMAPAALLSSLVTPAEDGLRLQLLVATLRTHEFEGFSPQAVATLLRMDLVAEDADTFTLTLAREPEQLDTLVELLTPFSPVELLRSDVVVTGGLSHPGLRTVPDVAA